MASATRLLSLGLVLATIALVPSSGHGQTTAPTTPPPHKSRATAKVAMAAWSPDVQKSFGVSADDFKTSGLNKLTQAQLTAMENAVKPDPHRHWLTCPANGTVPAGRVSVYLTVSGDDSTGEIAGQIRQSILSLSGVDLVTTAAQADRALHVVIQEQTTAKRTIGFTASYLTATPCTDEVAGKKTDVELKRTLGTYTDAKGSGLAMDLAGMLDEDLRSLRSIGTK
jgi:hypothetical protein